MKTLLIFLLSLVTVEVKCQDKVTVIFLANDIVEGKKPRLISRLIITGMERFNYPEPVEIYLNPVISKFGYFETEFFDSAKRKFIPAVIREFQDKVPSYDEQRIIKTTDLLNIPIDYIRASALDKGLFRTRVKIWLSRYNSDLPDLYSNWSYFYMR